jgi:hypothetical protein
MTSRPSTAAPILAVLAIVLVTLGAYVGGYLCLGELRPCHCRDETTEPAMEWVEQYRHFPYDLEDTLYKPLCEWETERRGRSPEVDPEYWIRAKETERRLEALRSHRSQIPP